MVGILALARSGSGRDGPVAGPGTVVGSPVVAIEAASAEAIGLGALVAEFLVVVGKGDPDLDADDAVGGVGIDMGVVDGLTEGVEGEDAIAILFVSGDFGAAKTALGHGLAALGTGSHDALDGLLLDDAEGSALLDLLGDVLRDQDGIQVGVLDFDDGDLDVVGILAEDLDQVGLDLLDVGGILSDDDRRMRDMDGDGDVVLDSLDVDMAETRIGLVELGLEVVADIDVLFEVRGEVLLVGVPVAGPLAVDAQSQAVRIDFLSHGYLASLFLRVT